MNATATASPAPGRRRLNTVAEVCHEYIQRAVAGKVGVGWANVRHFVAKFVAEKGTIRIEDVIADDLEKFIDDHPGWKSQWTKKRVAQTVKTAFAFAWKKGLIDRHPFAGVSFAQGERGKAMTDQQFRLILRNVSPEFRRVLLFLYWTGCRPGELAALKWAFIDTEKAVAVLHAHKTAHSSKAPRIICLPEKAIRLLTWMLDDQRGEQEYIFTNRHGRPWKRYALTLRIRRLRANLGLPPSCKLHGCRHAWITRLLVAKVPLATVSILAGHARVATTEHYAHLIDETAHLHKLLEEGLAHDPKDKKP